MRPRLLDLFACEGGASVGYSAAGFDVLAVDLEENRLKRNPHAWLVADAFAVIERYAHEYDAVHASPPCQDAGPEMRDPVALCGCMFDLSTTDTDGVTIHLQRLRLFETNWALTPPRLCDHSAHEWVAGAYGGARRDKYEAKYVRRGGYVPPDKAVVKALLGVEHDMTWEGLYECIPPAYTEWIGTQLLGALEGRAAA